MSWQGYGLAALLCVLGLVGFLIRRVYFHPLSQFPGPKLAAATSFIQFHVLWTGKERPWYKELHVKYGPVVRCGPNHLSFNDPDLIPIVYHRQADKTEYPQDFTCPGAAVNKANYAEYAAAKRKFGQAFSSTRVQYFEGIIDDQLERYATVLREQSAKRPLVDWGTLTRYFAFDVFVPMSLGDGFGFLDNSTDVRNLLKSSFRIFKRWTLSRYRPIAWLAGNTALGRWAFVSGRSDKQGMGLWTTEIHEIAQQRIAASASQKKPRYQNSMLDQWLAAKTVDGEAIPLAEIEDQIVSDVLGGPYAMAITVTSQMVVLASHREKFLRAQKEIDDAFESNTFAGEHPTYAECCQLPFVSACIREALRLTSTGSPRWRASPDRPLTLDGKHVPPGTAVCTSPLAISTHEKLYGDDAGKFVPERWIEASEEQLKVWNSYDAHWGFGYRKCPGRHIGIMVLYKSLVELLRRFDVQRETMPPMDDGVTPSSSSLVFIPRKL